MTTTKDDEQRATEPKPLDPPAKKKAPLPARGIPDFPGDGSGGGSSGSTG
jgi:hypothetical protein